MKCQRLFSVKNKKKSLVFTQRVVKVNVFILSIQTHMPQQTV